MNIIFIEPSFPHNQREFVRALNAVGANVIGIGERPVEYLGSDAIDRAEGHRSDSKRVAGTITFPTVCDGRVG